MLWPKKMFYKGRYLLNSLAVTQLFALVAYIYILVSLLAQST